MLSLRSGIIIIGISTKQVSDYEVGTSIPRKSTFKKILESLGVTEKEFFENECLFGNIRDDRKLASPILPSFDISIALILASASRGQLINIVGMEQKPPHQKEISINIYSGTITRTKQEEANYINVYYLTGEKEECIYIHKENFDNVLACMKSEIT